METVSAQALERLQTTCPEFHPHSFLARTGKCLLVRGTLAGQAAIGKCLVDPNPYWQVRLAEEIGWYRFFEQQAPPVIIPRLLFANQALSISILEFLEGQPLDQSRYVVRPLPPQQVEALLAQLARLHSWRAPQARSLSEIVAGYRKKFQSYISRGFLSAVDCLHLDLLLERERSMPEFNHGDLLPSNCLAHGSGLALIDWEFAGYYLPGYDLALLWTLLQADGAARRRIIEVIRQQGVAAERAFIINQMRVIAREIKIHQRANGGASHDQRIRWLQADQDTVRVWMQAHLMT